MRLKLVNDSSRPTEEITELLRFVLYRPQVHLGEGRVDVAVRVLDAGRRSHGHLSGSAGSLQRTGNPKWAGRAAYHTRLTIPGDDWKEHGQPRVCWHSTAARDFAQTGTEEDFFAHLAELYERGERKFGRWPIYVANDWRECFVHLAAHEIRHLVQFANQKPASEVDCEEFAAFILDESRSSPLTNLAGFVYDEAMTERIPELGSWWFFTGNHYEVVGHKEFDGEPALVLKAKGAKKPDPCSVVARLFLKKAVPSPSGISGISYTEKPPDDRATSRGGEAAADGSAEPTGKEVTVMTTATKQRRRKSAVARTAPKVKQLSGTRLADDLLAAVKEKSNGVKLRKFEKPTKREGMKMVKLAAGENPVVGVHLNVFSHRVRVWVRQPGEYAGYTVSAEKDIPKAATAIAAKVAAK